jgi:hypothetical protein
MCVYFHKNCNKISIFKFLAYRVYEGYDKAVEDETSHIIRLFVVPDPRYHSQALMVSDVMLAGRVISSSVPPMNANSQTLK